MPFTLAHPAVLFPLMKRNKYVSATALIIGSMVPDVEFIAQMQESSTYSHNFPGVFLINIPLGLLLCWFFHNYIKQGLINNLPVGLQARLQFMLALDWNSHFKKNRLVVISSLCVGVLSHLAWDAFTHDIGIFVNLWPVLKSSMHVMNREMPVFHFLQIISSVLGLLGTVYVVWKLPVGNMPTKKVSMNYWMVFGLFVIGLAVLRFVLFSFNNGFWDVVLAFMGIGMYALILNSLFHSLWPHKQAKPEP